MKIKLVLYSFRSRFQFLRQSNKKYNQQQISKTPPQTFKHPLLMDCLYFFVFIFQIIIFIYFLAASLSPVPEVDDYRLSDMGSERPVQALIHNEHDQSDNYYKPLEIADSDSNYTSMPPIHQGDYNTTDHNRDDSVIISVPTMFRGDDDLEMTTDGGESIYNRNYSIQSLNKNEIKRLTRPTIIVGHCQTDFQPLNPKLLTKLTDKTLLADHQQFYTYSQSFQYSAYDSGFFDERTMDSLTSSTDESEREENFLSNNRRKS